MKIEDEELTFVFPSNYDKNGKIAGLIDRSGLILAGIWAGSLLFLLMSLPITGWTKFYVFMFAGIPVSALMLVGLNGDPVILFVKYILKFFRNRKIYLYKKR